MAAVLPLLGSLLGGGEDRDQNPYGGGSPYGNTSSGGSAPPVGQIASMFSQQQPQSEQATEPENYSEAGVAEQAFQNTQGQYLEPPDSAQYFQSTQDQIPSNDRSARAYDNFQAEAIDFDPHFDRMRERALGARNDQAAARGSYGTSATMGGLSDAILDIESQRAIQERQYNLEQAQVAGQLGSMADQSGRANIGLGGQLAAQSDQSELANLGAYQQAAGQAQNAHRMRGRDYMSDIYTPTMMATQADQAAMQGMLGADNEYMDSIMALQLGAAGQGLAQSQYEDQYGQAQLGALLATLPPVAKGGKY